MQTIIIDIDRIIAEDGEAIYRGEFSLKYYVKGKSKEDSIKEIIDKIIKYIKIGSDDKIITNIIDMPVIKTYCHRCKTETKNTEAL